MTGISRVNPDDYTNNHKVISGLADGIVDFPIGKTVSSINSEVPL